MSSGQRETLTEAEYFARERHADQKHAFLAGEAWLTNPSLVVEVLSEATEAYDRGAKAQHDRQRASLRSYVLVAQDRRHVEVYLRGADGAWSLREYVGDAVIALPTLGIEVPLDEVYAGVR